MSGNDGHGEAVGKVQMLSALLQFCFSSVGMMLGNKLAVDYLKDEETGIALPSTLVLLQVIGTLLLLCGVRDKCDFTKLNKRVIISWLPIVSLFSGMLYTSAKTFQYVHVSFVIVMRNIGAIITTLVEYQMRGTTVNATIIASEVTIVIGTYIYGYGNHSYFKDFWQGSFWLFTNVMCQCFYGVTLKMKMDRDQDIKSMSKFTMSLFNNLLCLPYLITVAIVANEPASYGLIFPKLTAAGYFTIACTCAIGFMISTSGFGLQKLVSATTFLVVNNLTKVLNIVLGIILMGDTLPNTSSLLGCAISIAGGFWYSYTTMQARDQKPAASPPAGGDKDRGDVENDIGLRPTQSGGLKQRVATPPPSANTSFNASVASRGTPAHDDLKIAGMRVTTSPGERRKSPRGPLEV